MGCTDYYHFEINLIHNVIVLCTKTVRYVTFSMPLVNTRSTCCTPFNIGRPSNDHFVVIFFQVHMQYQYNNVYYDVTDLETYFFGYLLSISARNFSASFGSIFRINHCNISLFLSSSSFD
jgi:hypothetical protein